MDNLLIYSQTEEEHLKHIQLVFEKFWEAGIKLMMSMHEFVKSQLEYSGHLVSVQGKSIMKLKVQAIMDLFPTANLTEAHYMINLISYYRKFFPVFSDRVQPLNEVTKNNIPFKWMKLCQQSLDYVKQVFNSTPILVYADQINNITCSIIVANTHGVEFLYNIMTK